MRSAYILLMTAAMAVVGCTTRPAPSTQSPHHVPPHPWSADNAYGNPAVEHGVVELDLEEKERKRGEESRDPPPTEVEPKPIMRPVRLEVLEPKNARSATH